MTTLSSSAGDGRRPLLRPPEPTSGRRPPRRPLVQLELPLAAGRGGNDRSAGSGWRLDDHTRETGRAGVAAARAILARSAQAA